MIETALGIAQDELKNIGVPYEFMRWTSTVTDRYWVGEFTESPTITEDGYEEGTLILTGTTKGAWAVLMSDRAKIKDKFSPIGGLRTFNNGAVVIYYDYAMPIPTGDDNLKRFQVNLRIKAWKGIE